MELDARTDRLPTPELARGAPKRSHQEVVPAEKGAFKHLPDFRFKRLNHPPLQDSTGHLRGAKGVTAFFFTAAYASKVALAGIPLEV